MYIHQVRMQIVLSTAKRVLKKAKISLTKVADGQLTLPQYTLVSLSECQFHLLELLVMSSLLVHQSPDVRVNALYHAVKCVGTAARAVSSFQPGH